jgi:hypothetical protein
MIQLILCFFLSGFGPQSANAQSTQGRIEAISSATEVLISEPANGIFHQGDLLLIRAQGDNEILGYAEVTGREGNSKRVLARIRSHANNALIRIQDSVEGIDLTDFDNSKEQMHQGRHDLVIRGKGKISSKFKPQIYLGALTGQTAATLEENEAFLGIGLIGYGINESLQLSTQPILSLFGESNFQLKWQFIQNEDYRISLGLEPRYNLNYHRASGSFSVYWDTFSNSKFLTYNQLRVTTGESEIYDRRTSAEFSVNYGYITNRWNRVIFGPNIDIQKETLGGLLSFQWIWDHFHSAITIQARDFTNLKFGNNGYLVYLDFWWRI